jgi:excisionase family DNA binding protein
MRKKTITVPDAADYSGFSQRTIWRMIAAGELRATKVRSRTLVFIESLDEVLEAGAVEPAAIHTAA